MATTLSWNHNEENPLAGLGVNANVKRFVADLEANPKFLEELVEKYFLKNQHKLTMTMDPKGIFFSSFIETYGLLG